MTQITATLSPPAPKAQAVSAEMVAELRQLVRKNGVRWKTVILLEALGLGIAAPLGYLWLVFFLDNEWHLPLFIRLLASLGFLAGVGWAGTYLVRRWRKLHFSEDQVALAIEHSTPGVQNRLINAVQIARADHGKSPDLNEAVVRENCRRLRQIHLEQAAQLRPALLRLSLAGVAVVIGLTFWLVRPDQFANAASRILMFSQIDPLYRTRLTVEPGDVEAAGDVAIHITFDKDKERPRNVTVFKSVQGKQTYEVLPVETDDGPISYTFRDVNKDTQYWVRGGDFTSDRFQITVPRKATMIRMTATYHYPDYTGLPAKTFDSASGDLEALHGTKAKVSFVFDQPVDRADLVLEEPAPTAKSGLRGAPRLVIQKLVPVSTKEYSGEITLENAFGYRLETVQGDRPKLRSAPFAIRVLKDMEPKLELTGLERRLEVQIDSVLPLNVSATDDFGLDKVGLFFRPVNLARLDKNKPAAPDEGWQQVIIWPANRKTAFRLSHELSILSMKISEGDKIELALRGLDTDPLRQGVWTTGPIHELNVGGDGIALQLQYEQIVRSEKELKDLLARQQESLTQTASWVRKLDGADAKSIDALHVAVKDLGNRQKKLREDAGATARTMLPSAGNVRIAVGMLADAEMEFLLAIFDTIPRRDLVQGKKQEKEREMTKQAALADARVRQERIVRSLEDILEQYTVFRGDWELNHMIPFTKMLAERQTKLRDQSARQAGQARGTTEELLRQSMERRQLKILELCKLIQPAYTGLYDRLKGLEPILAGAFQTGASDLAGKPLQEPMIKGAAEAKQGRWKEAAEQQSAAAEQMNALFDRLRKAQIESAQKALAALKAKMKKDMEVQGEIEKLPPGSTEAFLKDHQLDKLKLEDLMRFWEVAGAKKSGNGIADEPDPKAPLLDVERSKIELEKDSGVRQDPYSLTLGKVAEKTPMLKMYNADKENVVKPFMQEKFDDLVGKLLDEADELSKKYQSIKLSTNQNNNDPGDISKVGGALNSTGAVTATGNKKPPTTESGGLAKTGRQGARAYGMVADDDGFDRRGRDKAQDGKEQIADQAGISKMKKTDDMQKDMATGVGGKKLQSDDSHFSLHDAGKWKDEYTKRMDKAQKKEYIVERQGDKIDAKTAALMRDVTSKQEQVIERLKAIKKELRNLYLPTGQFDEISAELEATLASLKEQPDADLFRLQEQTLDRLRNSLRVFRGANAGFQPSLPRERALVGRVLDEPGAQGIPGYEEAVRQYYKELANQ